jgi:hypothetical protein
LRVLRNADASLPVAIKTTARPPGLNARCDVAASIQLVRDAVGSWLPKFAA